jgi:hypothetical protein
VENSATFLENGVIRGPKVLILLQVGELQIEEYQLTCMRALAEYSRQESHEKKRTLSIFAVIATNFWLSCVCEFARMLLCVFVSECCPRYTLALAVQNAYVCMCLSKAIFKLRVRSELQEQGRECRLSRPSAGVQGCRLREYG